MPTLTSAARAGAVALTKRFRSDGLPPAASASITPERKGWQGTRKNRRLRNPHESGSGPSIIRFEAYVLRGERHMLLIPNGQFALLDIRTGTITWMPATRDYQP
jgi:hypothetical protein